jgi:hypothetical protein
MPMKERSSSKIAMAYLATSLGQGVELSEAPARSFSQAHHSDTSSSLSLIFCGEQFTLLSDSHGGRKKREEVMRTCVFAVIAAALFALPTSAFSEEIYVGPGGVKVGPGYHRYYNSADRECRELRQACLHKEELGEQGMGNCRRYREICR